MLTLRGLALLHAEVDTPSRSPKREVGGLNMGSLDGRLILLGVTGSIAAYKSAELARALTAEGADVQVLMSHTAQQFIGPLTLADADPAPADDRPARAAARPAHRAHRRRGHGRL